MITAIITASATVAIGIFTIVVSIEARAHKNIDRQFALLNDHIYDIINRLARIEGRFNGRQHES